MHLNITRVHALVSVWDELQTAEKDKYMNNYVISGGHDQYNVQLYFNTFSRGEHSQWDVKQREAIHFSYLKYLFVAL